MDKRNVLGKAHLVEPIVRHRIQDSLFYKQHLYLTNELTLLEMVVQHVHFLGGTDTVGRPTPFLCCLLRMLELEPLQDIIDLYLTQNGFNEFKYLTALGLIYQRMVMLSEKWYLLFDASIIDYRNLRVKFKSPKLTDGLPLHYGLMTMDEWVDMLNEQERVVDLIMPKLVPRRRLVDEGILMSRSYEVSDEETKESEDNYQSDSD